jgi:hypothetical protein
MITISKQFFSLRLIVFSLLILIKTKNLRLKTRRFSKKFRSTDMRKKSIPLNGWQLLFSHRRYQLPLDHSIYLGRTHIHSMRCFLVYRINIKSNSFNKATRFHKISPRKIWPSYNCHPTLQRIPRLLLLTQILKSKLSLPKWAALSLNSFLRWVLL